MAVVLHILFAPSKGYAGLLVREAAAGGEFGHQVACSLQLSCQLGAWHGEASGDSWRRRLPQPHHGRISRLL